MLVMIITRLDSGEAQKVMFLRLVNLTVILCVRGGAGVMDFTRQLKQKKAYLFKMKL